MRASISRMSSARFSSASNASTNHSEKMQEAILLQNPSVLRAVSANKVMLRFGRVLGSSASSADTYNLSFQVEWIDCFLSHNWLTQRITKFLVLAFHFNLGSAILALIFANVAVAVVMLSDLGLLKFIEVSNSLGGTNLLCPYASLVAPLWFLLLFWFKHDLASLMRLPGPATFLDKVCIHQTDEKLKAEGVKALAAFLYRSKSVLVLYNEHYLCRLWTVYELATCLIVNPGIKVVIIPVALPPVVLAMCILAFVSSLVQFSSRLQGDAGIGESNSIIAFFQSGIAYALLRCWAIDRSQMEERLQAFSVREASCYNQSDRSLVESNIASFLVAQGFVHEDASKSEALDAFDDIVHKHLPSALAKSIGRFGLSYRSALAMCCPLMSSSLDVSIERFARGDVKVPLIQICSIFAVGISIFPNCLALTSYLCDRTARWTSWKGVLSIGIVSVGLTMANIGLCMAISGVASRTGQVGPCVVSLFLLSFNAVVTVFAYRPRRDSESLVRRISFGCAEFPDTNVGTVASQASVLPETLGCTTLDMKEVDNTACIRDDRQESFTPDEPLSPANSTCSPRTWLTSSMELHTRL